MALTCPSCKSKVWDNRAEKAAGKRRPKYPDFKCSNKDCRGGRDGSDCWVGYGSDGAAACGADSQPAAAAAAPSGGGSSGRGGAVHNWKTLFATAEYCWKMAGRITNSDTTTLKEDHPNRASVFATLFIAANQQGMVIHGEKKAPPKPAAPPPPPPRPAPPPPPPDNDDGPSFDSDDDLPF